MENNRARFIKLIKQTANRHGIWTVFSDFLLMTATAISNSIDKRQFEIREKEYMNTIKKYNKAEQNLIPQMYAELVLELQKYAEERQPCDVLGEVFHELELHNKWHGQYFSPKNICDMMGEVSIGKKDSSVEKKGFITINEPCSGGGAMLFGFAKAFAKRGYNYCNQMLVEASDIDIKCVYMTYIQLSLYGIPAVVYHRNTITMETWSVWYTPIYILNGWERREYMLQELKKLKEIPPKQKAEIQSERNFGKISLF